MNNEPRTFIEAMEQLFGQDEATMLFDAIGERPAKSIRWNAMYPAPDFPGWTPVPWYPGYRQLLADDAVPSLTTDYALGRYYIQDAGSMLTIGATALTGEINGTRILDLCAAPGGKTTHAAEYARDGFVVANEVVGNRLDALRWNITEPDVATYLKGQDLRGEWPAGYCFTGWEENPLGLGKVSNGRMANHFPKAMRNR